MRKLRTDMRIGTVIEVFAFFFLVYRHCSIPAPFITQPADTLLFRVEAVRKNRVMAPSDEAELEMVESLDQGQCFLNSAVE